MVFSTDGQTLVGKQQYEILTLEPWGKNALRVRSFQYTRTEGCNWALESALAHTDTDPSAVIVNAEIGTIRNGKLSATVNPAGVISFYKDGKRILREHHRNWGTESKESRCLKLAAREFDPIVGGEYRLTVRFESTDGEKIFGMGNYQHAYLDLKGCILELAQRNSQVSVPFMLSSLGYGFLWNNPAVGRAVFGKNFTEWRAEATDRMDYWITADDTPACILQNYTGVTGRAPLMPENVLGLWQSKLRYRTQDELLQVAREYKRLGIPLDVIVADFFHWVYQGEWSFDPEYWPDPKAMTDELKAMGTRLMVSVWPTVDRRSSNFKEMLSRGLLVRTEGGSLQTHDFCGDCVYYDATNPEARAYLWNKCKENYLDKYGIDLFWLDEAEPEYSSYDFDQYRYFLGPDLKVGNIYPTLHAKAFYDGLKAENRTDIVSLVRSAWAGSQKYAALVWSGDVPTTFEAFRDQLYASLNMGLAGIPWWTSDIGGFLGGDANDPAFIQLIVRWFQFAVFCPITRMHGDRDPHNIPLLSDKDYGGGFLPTGQPNELWSYGEEAFGIFKKYLDLRLSMKPYIAGLMREAHETGAPLMRTMFYEFPQDEKCWTLHDQYMFGPDYLVAPVVYADCFSRSVYLPSGSWEDIDSNTVFAGGQTVECSAPLERIPVFKRLR